MSNNIKEIIAERDNVKFATDAGTNMHNRLGRVVIDGEKTCGDSDLIARIRAIPNLAKLFSSNSMVEVPVAGNIGARFVSRRIDRLYIDEDTQTIYVLDYKTDVNHTTFRDKYIAQLREYSALLSQVCPDYKCFCFILWACDWVLESV